MLAYAFDSRLDSDYDIAYMAEKTTAENVLKDAHRFVKRIERYFEEYGNDSTN